MWTLLLWLNQKVINLYKRLQAETQQKKHRQEAQDIRLLSHRLPDYLRRDMGLPPYDSGNKHDL